MANKNLKFNSNADGNFFVDSSCIDCGTCYWVAPETFRRSNGHSIVYHQPLENEEAAYRALYSCPTNSIGALEKGDLAKTVAKSFPHHLEGQVYHCGFHAESSYGASSYFIERPEGNVLIDSPRYLKKLTSAFDDLGGIELQLLTHKDDIADTDLYWDEFKGQRWIHRDDTSMSTSSYEKIFSGFDEIAIDKDLKIIPVPGHTKGSVCYLYKDLYLFTGDHLAFSPELGHLYAFKTACWYDFSIQIKSMEKLKNYKFEYVLPGHGSPIKFSAGQMQESLDKCITWMKKA
jgi:ferredoxin